MPVYKLDIQKAVGNEYWTNRYFVTGASFTDGLAVGDAVAAIERVVHGTYVQFISLRVSTPTPDRPSLYMTKTLAFNGQRGPLDSFPLTTCSRIELFKGPRRPDVRYLRGCAASGDTADIFTWSPTFIQYMLTNYVNPLLDVPGLVDAGNAPYQSGRLSPRISTHQLRSGTRRKKTPVIPTH